VTEPADRSVTDERPGQSAKRVRQIDKTPARGPVTDRGAGRSQRSGDGKIANGPEHAVRRLPSRNFCASPQHFPGCGEWC
jgi:hypothetical protein